MAEHELPVKPPWRSPWWIATVTALSIGVALGFLGSISWVFHRNRLATAPFQALFAASTFAYLVLIAVKVWLKSRLSSVGRCEGTINRKTLYSFPRRFGLGTLLVVTFAFGGLTAFCQWLQWPTEVVLGILLFFSLVSAVQFAFERAPREASFLVGSVVLAGCVFAWRAIKDPRMAFFTWLDIAFFAAVCAFFGGLIGYCTGTLVGSVFMFMAGARAVFKSSRQ